MRDKSFKRWFKELQQLYFNRGWTKEALELKHEDHFDDWADGKEPIECI